MADDVFSAGLFPVCPATHDQGLRWLFDLSTVLLLLDCQPGDRVLDIGAGSGFSSEMLARLGYIVLAVDPDRQALRHTRQRPGFDARRIQGRVLVSQGVAEYLPVASESIDGVLGLNVLHHVPDLGRAAAELARVLKPGARAVFCEPGLDHLSAGETQRARQEHGEDDHAFDVLRFLRTAIDAGFEDAMLSATLQSPLRLLPLAEVELYRSGRHPRAHLTPAGVVDELHRRHAYAMLQQRGRRSVTSRRPGRMTCQLRVAGVPASAVGGEHLAVHVAATNSGDTLWLSRPSPLGGYVTFGCKLLNEEGRLVDDTLGRTPLVSDVPPGGEATATLDIAVPSTLPPGRYLVRIDMVDELVCWFSDRQDSQVSEHTLEIAAA